MAEIIFRCAVCQHQLAVEDVAAGRETRCPQCGAVQAVPAPARTGTPVTARLVEENAAPVATLPKVQNPPDDKFEYEAFISYHHVEPDRTWAKWLHTQLETYKLSRRLAGERGLPRRLRKLFRDEEELPASADLSREIERALAGSRFLIVVCSPRTPASEWVNAEVQMFRNLGRHDRILALLIEGEPGESFPQALREIRRTIADNQGLTWEQVEEVEPLAADVRTIRKESRRYIKRMAKLRMLACILGVPFDDLRGGKTSGANGS